MDELIQAGIVRELNEKNDMNSWFVKPVIILPKKDYVKLVLDARYLNSIKDNSNCSWPLEPLQVLMTRINGSYFTSSDLSCAYHQVPLTDEAQKLTSLIVGGRQYTYQVGFYGLKPLPIFFSKLMRYAFRPLIKEKKAINYIDDTLLQSQNKNELIETFREYHYLLRKANLKAAPDNTFFFLRKVNFPGHVVSKDGLSPIASRIDVIKKMKTRDSKTKILGVLGVMGFYSTYIINFHVGAKCPYELANSNDKFQWLPCHEEVFQQLKNKCCHDISNAIPNVNYPFHIHADSSNVGTGCILIQDFPEGKRIVSTNSRVFDKAEQKMSNQHRELCGIISALQTYEFYIIGSPFPLYLYCDHRPILFLWHRKGQLLIRFFKYQVALTKFNNLKIIYTPGSNLAFPDLLSRNVPIDDIKKYQFEHKTIPNDIKLILDNGEQIRYSVLHKDDNNIFQNDCYPVNAQVQGGKKKLINISDRGDFSIEDAPEYFAESCSAIQNITDFFRFGKQINQIKQLSIPDINNENIYEEIPVEISALDDPLENSEWIDLDEGNVENNLLNDLVKAKTEFATKTRSLKLNEPLSLQSEENKSDSLELIAKITDFAKEANLDVETVMQEQCNDTVVIDIKNCIKQNEKPERNKKILTAKKRIKSLYQAI